MDLYILVIQPPFYDKNKDKLYKKIIFNEPDFTKNLSVKPSNEAKDLILRLLDKNQKNRIKIGQVKTHKFFEGINFQDVYDGKIVAPFIPDKESNKYVDPNLLNEKPEDSVVTGYSPIMMKGRLVLIQNLKILHMWMISLCLVRAIIEL